ncbi:MAG: hypothetical protein KVP17_005212, partial [Porospora cf. gigantea B]|uniref:uncharacterized protein n=1 Tax=Porospora cf. gigantea B TaxID=2853592 RepID=UPI00357185EB
MQDFRSDSLFGHLLPRDSNVSPLLADSCCNISPLIPPFYDPCAFNMPGKVWPPQAPKASDHVAEPQNPIWQENESWIPETGSLDAKRSSPSKCIHKVDPKKKKKRKRRKPVQLEDAEFAWNMANVTKTSGMSPYVWFLMARRPELILAGVPQQ